MRYAMLLLTLLLPAASAWSDQVGLRPPGSAVELRAYGLGMIPLDGKFSRFHGWMRYNPSDPGACQVVLDIEAGSLSMANKSIRDRITGPGMMDVARFPDLTFHGACHGDAVIGDLTMHGQTHPVTLRYSRSMGSIVATGRVRRAEWGILGSPLVGGSTIRIRVSMPDAANGQHA